MNRLTRYAFEKVHLGEWRTAASCMMMASADPVYQRAFQIAEARARKAGRAPNAAPILKFFARTRLAVHYKVPRGAEDRYRMLQQPVWCFNGAFGYNPDAGGYVPFGCQYELTGFLADYVVATNGERIAQAWAEIRRSLRAPNGGPPVLVHKFEKQHVYFIRRPDTGEIKIGISVRPGIRRIQLMTKLRVSLEILHILPAAGREVEKSLHARFASLCAGGEWFRPEPELLDFIKEQQRAPAAA